MLSKIGAGEIIVILIIALLIFGPDKLPQLGRNMGKAIGSVKKYMRETTDELKEAMEDMEDVKKEVKDIGDDLKNVWKDTEKTAAHAPDPEKAPAAEAQSTSAGQAVPGASAAATEI